MITSFIYKCVCVCVCNLRSITGSSPRWSYSNFPICICNDDNCFCVCLQASVCVLHYHTVIQYHTYCSFGLLAVSLPPGIFLLECLSLQLLTENIVNQHTEKRCDQRVNPSSPMHSFKYIQYRQHALTHSHSHTTLPHRNA